VSAFSRSAHNGNPLVNVFALGVFRKDRIFYAKASGVVTGYLRGSQDGARWYSCASMARRVHRGVEAGSARTSRWAIRSSKSCCSKPVSKAMKTGRDTGHSGHGGRGLTCSTCEMGGRGGVGIESI